jgi:hypothetical protein
MGSILDLDRCVIPTSYSSGELAEFIVHFFL